MDGVGESTGDIAPRHGVLYVQQLAQRYQAASLEKVGLAELCSLDQEDGETRKERSRMERQ